MIGLATMPDLRFTDAEQHRLTLYIDKSESSCGNCGRNAFYNEFTHDTVYAPGEGCQVRWEFVSSNYMGLGIGRFAADVRPDLKWIGPDDYVYWYEKVSLPDE